MGTSQTAREIITYPASLLRNRAAKVTAITDQTREIAEAMAEVVIRANGIGLAAPQIGTSKRIIVIDLEGTFHVLINPVIIDHSDKVTKKKEGCLSVPGVEGEVSRSSEVTVQADTLDNKKIEITGEDLLARVLLHEIDHLNGVLFIDHLDNSERKSALKQYRALHNREER